MAKKKIKENLTCGYCTVFNTSRDRVVNETDGKERYSRFCVNINHRVLSTNEACEDLILYKYFWCNNCDHWVSLTACINKERCGYISTLPKNCKQRKSIMRYLNDVKN